jgi:iron(III) transport system permease protein
VVNGWTAAAGVLALLLSVPLITVVVRSLAPAGETWRHLASTVLAGYVATSVLLVAAVGALALVIGVATAWLVATCEFPGRRLFEWGLVMPLAVPAYIAAFTYAGMLGVTGPVQRLIRGVTPGWADRFIWIDVMRVETVILILALVLYPYVYLLGRATFLRQSRTALEAARTLGRSAWGTFFRVALPLARPAVAAGVALVAMEVLNDYGAVRYYGVSTLTTGIFRAWFGLGDVDAAVRLAAFLMLFVFAVLALERLQRGRRRFDDGDARHRPLRRFELRGWRALVAFLVCLVPVLFGFLLPVGQLGLWSVRTASEVIDGAFLRLVLHSFGLATLAAALCVAAGLLVAWAVRVARSGALRGLSRVSVLGYSVPGAVIAVGVMIPLIALDRSVDAFVRAAFGVSTGLLLSGSLAALVFAYVVRFVAVAQLPIESGLDRVCGNMDDAARLLGATPGRTLRRVGLPLLRGTLFGALILVFVDVLKELPLTLILRPFNFDTLATRAFQLATDEMVAHAAPAALVIILTGVVPVVVLSRLFVRRET